MTNHSNHGFHPIQGFKHAIKVLAQDIIFHGLALFTFLLIGVATVFYHIVEKWSWVDAIYFSVITISTVGFGDITPHTPAGKLFTVFYILCGLGLFVTVTANVSDRILKAATQRFNKKEAE